MINARDDLETDDQREREAKFYKLEFMTTQITGLTTRPETPAEDEEKLKDIKSPTGKDRGKDKLKDKEKPKDKAKEKEKKKEEVKERDETEGEGEDKIPKRPLSPRIDQNSKRWREEILNLKRAKVIRFPKVLQSIFYLLQYSREAVCEEKTNKLFWKKAKELIDDNFLMGIFKYNPIGPKQGYYQAYQKINYIRKMLEDIDIEAVENYS